KEIEAQAAITQMFGQLAPRAGAEFADYMHRQALDRGEETEAQAWAQGGAYRIALHGLIGALAGGADGAAGAAAGAALTPQLGALIYGSELPEPLRQALVQVAAVVIGAAAGGPAGAAASFNEASQNWMQFAVRVTQLAQQAGRVGLGAINAEGRALLAQCAGSTLCSALLPAAVIGQLAATSQMAPQDSLVGQIPGYGAGSQPPQAGPLVTPIPGQAGANIESYPAQGPDTGSNHTGNTAPAPQLPTILVTPVDFHLRWTCICIPD
ncbi:MAG: hypothetical protein B6D47_00485, partial [Rhodocyclaceae bacterium UTPRO2]